MCRKGKKDVKSHKSTSKKPIPSELNSDHIEDVLVVLREKYGQTYAGLQSSIVGQCIRYCSVPKFQPAGKKRFVQIFNTGDHWVCATNVFASKSHTVYVYDSLYARVSNALILQVSSLLRAEDKPDEIEFCVRHFQQQQKGTRLCGFYAVAACVSCVLQQDPTGRVFEESQMPQYFYDLVHRGAVRAFPSMPVNVSQPMPTETHAKVHCLCHKESNASPHMIQCPRCQYWFHLGSCVPEPATPRTLRKMEWICPSCTLHPFTAGRKSRNMWSGVHGTWIVCFGSLPWAKRTGAKNQLSYFCLQHNHLECRSETCSPRVDNTGRKVIVKKSPSGHHRATLSGCIFATKARIDNRKKTC